MLLKAECCKAYGQVTHTNAQKANTARAMTASVTQKPMTMNTRKLTLLDLPHMSLPLV